jgi:GntR family transcriptional regulator
VEKTATRGKAVPPGDSSNVVSPRANNEFAVDKTLPAPLYHQVYTALRDRIFDGTYHPGGRLPSETELIDLFGVSRITVRRALDELSTRGLVLREQGRYTQVAPYRPGASLRASVEGLIENNLRMAEQTTVEVVEFDYVPADKEVGEALQISQGDIVQWAIRVRSLETVPFSYIVTYLPEQIARTFRRQDLSSTPFLVLLERCGVSVVRAEQTITAVSADRVVAKALQVEPGTALLQVLRKVYDAEDRPVQFLSVQYRPDMYRYDMSLERTNGPEGRIWAPQR